MAPRGGLFGSINRPLAPIQQTNQQLAGLQTFYGPEFEALNQQTNNLLTLKALLEARGSGGGGGGGNAPPAYTDWSEDLRNIQIQFENVELAKKGAGLDIKGLKKQRKLVKQLQSLSKQLYQSQLREAGARHEQTVGNLGIQHTADATDALLRHTLDQFNRQQDYTARGAIATPGNKINRDTLQGLYDSLSGKIEGTYNTDLGAENKLYPEVLSQLTNAKNTRGVGFKRELAGIKTDIGKARLSQQAADLDRRLAIARAEYARGAREYSDLHRNDNAGGGGGAEAYSNAYNATQLSNQISSLDLQRAQLNRRIANKAANPGKK